MSDRLTPRITIVTVCLNAVSTIEQTILSVLHQSYPNIEYIIIDGVSIDGTLDIIKKYQERLAYWSSEPDQGIFDAMNKGIDAATGDYIYFLGADDCLLDCDAIARVSRHLLEDIDVLCGRIYVVDDVLKTRMQRLTGRELSREDVFSGGIAPHQGMFVRTELQRKYKFNPKYKIAGDYDFFLALNKNGHSIRYVEDVVAFYSNGGIGCSRSMSRVYECLDSIGTHLSDEYVRRYRQREGAKSRLWVHTDRLIRMVLSAFGLIRFYRLYYGCEHHRCTNELCRWCEGRGEKA